MNFVSSNKDAMASVDDLLAQFAHAAGDDPAAAAPAAEAGPSACGRARGRTYCGCLTLKMTPQLLTRCKTHRGGGVCEHGRVVHGVRVHATHVT